MSDVTSPALTMIPAELRERAQWVAWRFEHRPGEEKPTKVPYSARSGRRASSTDPGTWSSYALACQYQQKAGLSGIGFVFSDDDEYVCMDLDHVRDPATGEIEPWARAYVERLSSYTELSPSGTGLHLIMKGALPGARCRTGQVELYETGRFLTFTGQVLDGTPTSIEYRIPELRRLHRELFPQTAVSAPLSPTSAGSGPRLDDATLLEKASSAKDGPRFRQLWSGDTSGNGDDDSSADLGLCNLLAFWTGGDLGQMDRLFRQSGLLRPKWDERHGAATYGELTMTEALQGRTEFYRPLRATPSRLELNLNELPDDAHAALVAEIERLRTENAALREELAQLHERQRLTMSVLRNRNIKSEKLTAVAAIFAYDSALSRGLVEEDGFTATPLAAIADNTGSSPRRVSVHLNRLSELGVLEKRTDVTTVRLVDRETGEVRYEPRTAVKLRLPQESNQVLRDLAQLEPEKPKIWGGPRLACTEHPEGGTVKRWSVECAQCTAILDQGESYSGPIVQPDTSAILSATKTWMEHGADPQRRTDPDASRWHIDPLPMRIPDTTAQHQRVDVL
jgi:putative DNA primase/helicase